MDKSRAKEIIIAFIDSQIAMHKEIQAEDEYHDIELEGLEDVNLYNIEIAYEVIKSELL